MYKRGGYLIMCRPVETRVRTTFKEEEEEKEKEKDGDRTQATAASSSNHHPSHRRGDGACCGGVAILSLRCVQMNEKV